MSMNTVTKKPVRRQGTARFFFLGGKMEPVTPMAKARSPRQLRRRQAKRRRLMAKRFSIAPMPFAYQVGGHSYE